MDLVDIVDLVDMGDLVDMVDRADMVDMVDMVASELLVELGKDLPLKLVGLVTVKVVEVVIVETDLVYK